MQQSVRVGKMDFGNGKSPCEWVWVCVGVGDGAEETVEHLDLKNTLKACHSCGTSNMVV